MIRTTLTALALTGALFCAPVQAMSKAPETGYTQTKYPIVLARPVRL